MYKIKTLENGVHQFPNVGYFIDELPADLLNSLKEEGEEAINLRKKEGDNLAGLTSSLGVARHVYVEKSRDKLYEFVWNVFNKFNDAFKYSQTFSLLSSDVPFYAGVPWLNIQEKNEYIPSHYHEGIVSYAIWVKIPYEIKDEFKGLPHTDQSTACFGMTYVNAIGDMRLERIPITKEYEGKILMFPSKLIHGVYPYYSSDESRISVSGNIFFDTSYRNN